MTDDWWREKVPETEKILWHGQPYQGYFPPRYGWIYKAAIVLFVSVWAGSPWIIDTAEDFWKLLIATLTCPFAVYADRFVRANRVYVVTSQNAWQLNRHNKSKKLKVDRFLDFYASQQAVSFARHPFFSFDHLPDPDAAMTALTKVREAKT
ncbi:hypothetical protein [Ruegeria sp. HKCCA5491]|uniref:hypothetical protein n=1 Tax=Ruegeria sp. HKCCA5491 TaxID=2682986 RepID=UPI001489A6D2|nr:hypothetical protein [Ruegeria sp. HKCCA5491]